jgi:hypothetical protein
VKKFFLMLLLVLYAASMHAQTNLSFEIKKLLPAGKCNVDVMDVAYPKRFLELTEKLQASIVTNRNWWIDDVKKASPGEPLAYDPKLGMTKEEYAEYLSLGEQRKMEKVRSAIIQVETNANSFKFDGGPTLPDLTGVEIDLNNLTIVTPFAVLKNPSPEVSSGGPGLGAYSGYQWHFESGDIDKGNITTTSFLVGRLKPGEKKFIYYKGGVAAANYPVSNVSLVIYYN